MAQQIDTNQLKHAEAAATLAKSLITQAIEQSAANQQLAQEALKQAAGLDKPDQLLYCVNL